MSPHESRGRQRQRLSGHRLREPRSARLYRTDDSGGLNFTLLASASADIGTAPRRLRLESEGNTHRVYFNGVLMITHVATGTIYATGQPGIAASVFGGPQVKILSFEGGSLGANPVDTTPPETTITSGPDAGDDRDQCDLHIYLKRGRGARSSAGWMPPRLWRARVLGR